MTAPGWEHIVMATVAGKEVVDTERQKVPGGWLYRTHTWVARRYETLSHGTPYIWEAVRTATQTAFVPEVPDAR